MSVQLYYLMVLINQITNLISLLMQLIKKLNKIKLNFFFIV